MVNYGPKQCSFKGAEMPGISQGYSMAAHANIDRAIRNTCNDPKSLEDAFKILRLTGKAHIWEDRLLEGHIILLKFMFRVIALFAVIMSVFALFNNPSLFVGEMTPVWIILLAIVVLTALEPRWSAKRIRRAKDELDLLTKQQPEYWEPLISRVEQIVINHGNSEHSLLGFRQVTRLTDSKS